MKRLLILAALLAGPAGAEPLLGTWSTAPDDNGNTGHITIANCGNKFCGTLVAAFDPDGQPAPSDRIGTRILWDMVSLGDGRYGKGKIYAPDRDKTYGSRLKLSGDTLAVSGCVLGICRDGGTWQRVD